jgi:hypothetical protein
MTVQGKRVGTLELINYNGRLTGSISNGHADIDSNGKLTRFEAIPGAAPIVEARTRNRAVSSLKDLVGGERGGLGNQCEVGANYSGRSATAAALR